MNASEFAEQMDVAVQTVRKACRQGRLAGAVSRDERGQWVIDGPRATELWLANTDLSRAPPEVIEHADKPTGDAAGAALLRWTIDAAKKSPDLDTVDFSALEELAELGVRAWFPKALGAWRAGLIRPVRDL